LDQFKTVRLLAEGNVACCKNVLSLLVALSLLSVFGGTSRADAAPVASQYRTGQDGQVLLAEGKKKRKKGKKKRKKSSDEEAPAEGAEGSGLHAAQAGAEEPYKWQVSLLSDFALNNSQTGEAKSGTADYDLSTKVGYIIASSIIAGGGLDYSESAFKTEEDTNTTRSYLLKFFGAYNFGDLDKDEMVFYAQLGLGIGSSSSKAGDAETSASSTSFGLGVGMHYFVDSNVALTGEFSYDTGSSKVKDQDEPTKFSSIHLMRIGFSLFL